MKKFYPIRTNDGSVSLFNTEINDIYHSNIGAYTEALNKFVLPSGMLDYVKSNNKIKILDICYGLGYNSKVAVNEIWKINPECSIDLTCLEIDPNVLAFSALMDFISADQFNKDYFKELLLKDYRIRRLLKDFINDVSFKDYVSHEHKGFLGILNSRRVKTYIRHLKNAKKHNIYYKTLSIRNKYVHKATHKDDFIHTNMYIGDARKIITKLNSSYSFIFLDAFTPSKAPALWSVDFFRHLYNLLDQNGNLTTYSSSAAVRSGMLEVGFHIGRTDPIGRRSSGTIAYKDKELLKNGLLKQEKDLMETKSGIPYYDPDLSFNTDMLLKYRAEIYNKSTKITSSQYFKNINS